MCGRMQLVISPEAQGVKLLRVIPTVIVAIPAKIKAPTLHAALDELLDDDQLTCAKALWANTSKKRYEANEGTGSVYSCAPLR